MSDNTPVTQSTDPTKPLINVIYLEGAVDQIKQACDERSQNKQSSPFFFLVGAGISYPPIPLAGAIVEECKAKAVERGRLEEPKNPDAMDTYSHWFQAAYPQPMERQNYLREKMQDKSISHANFRLAHILLHKEIANLVVTPNFDDLLQRALTLFGKIPIVCDHPKTVERIYHEQDDNDIRIVHVHGTYWFYDCVNLRGELEGRARIDAQSTLTMSALLTKILADRSPLVVGYSGWEGDVIMKSLELLFNSRHPPYNIYWFCYKRSDIDRLPQWLKNQSVYFVVPKEDVHNPIELEGNNEIAEGVVTADKEPVLMAQQVFDAVIKQFNLPAPDLTTNPLKFFAKNLHDALPQDEAERGNSAPYFFGSIIERIEKVRDTDTALQSQMEKVRDAVRRSQYEEAVTAVQGIRAESLTKTELVDLLSLSQIIAPGVASDALKQKLLYGAVTHFVDAFLAQENPDDLEVQKRIAWALACKAYWFADASSSNVAGSTNLLNASTGVCNDIIKRFASSLDLELRVQVAWAMMREATNFIITKQNADAIEIFDKIVQSYGMATELDLQKHVAFAFSNKATQLNLMKEYQKAISVCDEMTKAFSQASDPVLHQQVVQITLLKAQALTSLQSNLNQNAASTQTASEKSPAEGQAQTASLENAEKEDATQK